MSKVQAVILAAGKGTRLKATRIPKALYPILGRPMIEYLIESLEAAGFKKPIVVIGFRGNKIKELLSDRAEYVWQKKRLGTGHAVMKAKEKLSGINSVLVVLGDMPFWKSKTIQRLIKTHFKSGATISLVSVILKNPSFFQYGRIVRDKNNKVVKIVEEKEATKKEKQIKECNPSLYLIKANWLWKNLPKIKKSKAGEYYLPDILELAVQQGEKINVVSISDWKQTFGINTKEQLKLAEKIIQKKSLAQPD